MNAMMRAKLLETIFGIITIGCIGIGIMLSIGAGVGLSLENATTMKAYRTNDVQFTNEILGAVPSLFIWGDIYTAGKFHGDGSLLTGIAGGPGGDSFWTNNPNLEHGISYGVVSSTVAGTLTADTINGAQISVSGQVAGGSGSAYLGSDGGASFSSGILIIDGNSGTIASQAGASFANGNCTIDGTTGKVTATGVIDPPTILLDITTEVQFLQIVADQVPEKKQAGLLLRYDGTNLLGYQANSGDIFQIPMAKIGNVKLPSKSK